VKFVTNFTFIFAFFAKSAVIGVHKECRAWLLIIIVLLVIIYIITRRKKKKEEVTT